MEQALASLNAFAAAGTQNLAPWVALGVALLILIWWLGNYNALVKLRQHTRESWSCVDAELKRRYELIPNLVEVVKGAAAHESKTLEMVVAARARAAGNHGKPADQARDENELARGVGKLIALSESYPDLKVNENFLELQRELAITEDRIQAARRFYNGNVRDLNTPRGDVPQQPCREARQLRAGRLLRDRAGGPLRAVGGGTRRARLTDDGGSPFLLAEPALIR
jgi:LemA protein